MQFLSLYLIVYFSTKVSTGIFVYWQLLSADSICFIQNLCLLMTCCRQAWVVFRQHVLVLYVSHSVNPSVLSWHSLHTLTLFDGSHTHTCILHAHTHTRFLLSTHMSLSLFNHKFQTWSCVAYVCTCSTYARSTSKSIDVSCAHAAFIYACMCSTYA